MLDKKMSSESIFDSMLPLSIDQFINPTLSLNNNDNNDDIYDYEEDFLSSPSSTTLDFDKSYGGLDMSMQDLNNSEDMYSEFNMDLLNSWQLHSDFNEPDVLNHDCMWAGHCESIEHAEEARSSSTSSSSSLLIPKPPVMIKQEFCEPAPVKKTKSSSLAGGEIKQESILKSSIIINNKSASATTTNLLIQQQQQQQQQHNIVVVPQTPPESDDEEIKAHRKNKKSGLGSGLLNLLNEAINECDSDLTEYFESKDEIIDVKEEPIGNGDEEELTTIKEELNYDDDDEDDEDEEEEEEEEEEEVQNYENAAVEKCESSETDENMSFEEFRIRTQLAAENDHSYHSKSAVISHSNYGLDTPSDSEEEEEIDVVSVTEKFSINALPTNPSSKDRHQLQRRVATAISKTSRTTNNNIKNKISSTTSTTINNTATKTRGLKTILPIRKSISTSDSSSTVSATPSSSNSRNSSSRGVKRGRGGGGGASRNGTNNRKRRKTSSSKTASNNVEKEPPTDKRHLHNDMERQRRIDLRVAFDNLKAVVPEVSGTKKIAKVNILLQASQYCYYLTNQGCSNARQIEEMRKKQSWLRNRVSQLRKNLASARR